MVSLEEAQHRIRTADSTRPCVSITFDDGYADNVYFGKQLLEKYNIPATVFIASDHIGLNREFWWDELERLILLPDKLPEKFDLHINGDMHTWVMDNSTQTLVKGWNVQYAEDPSPRYSFYRDLHVLLKPLNHNEREKVLDQIISHVDASSKYRDTHKIITRNELLELSNSNLIDIGAHTVTHPRLSVLPKQEQSYEIKMSKKQLEKELNRPVKHFSYPYGSQNDYNSDSVSIVKDSEFDIACSNYSGTVTKISDSYELPRMLVRDWDCEQFTQNLKRWSFE